MTTTLEKILPTGKSWRELWLAQNISGTNWPSSVPGGQPLVLTNAAAKRTTADGVHFIAGVATSNVKFADPYDAVNDWWVSFRFKLDQDFSSASSTDQYLVAKYVDGTNYLNIFLRASDGALVMDHTEAGGQEIIVSAETSWTAGTWYHVLCSISTTNGKRLVIDGGTAVTEAADQTAISLIADFTIGARDDGTSTEGFAGVISDVVMGNDALTTTAGSGEEARLAEGIPPSDAVNLFTLDEGRGTTANDRGSGADNGTLDSSCTWAYSGTKQAVMSIDGINDYAVSSAGVRISGDTTLVWIGKMKSTYTQTPLHRLIQIYIDGNNSLQFYGGDTGLITFRAEGSNTAKALTHTITHSIDDYIILMGTLTFGGVAGFIVNGVSVDTDTAVGRVSGDNATAYIGAANVPDTYDVSKTILAGLIESALSVQEAINLSRYFNNWLGLGRTI